MVCRSAPSQRVDRHRLRQQIRLACQRACAVATAIPALMLGLLGAPSAQAQANGQGNAGGIYTCTDAQGKRLTADRPIPECAAKEQQVLNRDGSLRSVMPPTLTAQERAQKEVSERQANELRAAQADAVRRDRNLMARYANEAAHLRSREASLDTVRLAIKASEIRLRELAQARKPLLEETEFYKGKPMPPKLKAAIDANDAALDAQRAATANQEAELDRINAKYDAELDRLRRLWTGAAPGTLAAAPVANTAATKPAAKATP